MVWISILEVSDWAWGAAMVVALQGTEINMGALIISPIRIGFWGLYYTITLIREPPKSYSDYIGPYIRSWGLWVEGGFGVTCRTE